MITIDKFSYPDHKPCLLPNQLVFDTGYSHNNYNIIFDKSLELKLCTPDDFENDFFGYFKLYDKLIKQDKHIRNLMPELGYSPYNLCLIIDSLEVHKKVFAQMIGCSFPKIALNTACRHNECFSPLVANQWQEILVAYQECVRQSDKHHHIHHDYTSLFYLKSDPNLPINIPEF